MSLYAIPLLASSLLGFSSAVFLLLKSKGLKLKPSTIFAFIWLGDAIWFFGYFLMILTKDKQLAIMFARFAYLGVMLIPTLFYHFTISFLDIKNKERGIRFVYLQFLFFVILLFNTDFIVSGVYNYFYGFHTKVGKLHFLFLLSFVYIFLTCFFKLYRGLRKERHTSLIEYNRIKYIFLTWIIASIGATDFIADYGIEYYPLGFIPVHTSLLIITYAIIHFRVMDINVAISRVGVFTFVYALVLGVPFAVGGAVSDKGMGWWVLPLVIMAILASAGPFIYMTIQRKIEARLRAEEFKAQSQLRDLSHDMIRFTKLDGLLKLIVHNLVKIFKLKFAAVYLYDESLKTYTLRSFWQVGSHIEPKHEFLEDSNLIKEIKAKKLPIVTEEFKLFKQKTFSPYQRELVTTLTDLKINTIIPSFMRDSLLGFLILSDRRTNIAFTQEDLNLLMLLSNEAALAIENAQFHQKERSVLAEKSRREALADMAPGASHQFNNRLAAISSSAEFLLMKLEDVKIDNMGSDAIKAVIEDAKRTLELIDKEVFKGKEITSAILKRAKAKVDFQEVDVKTILDNAYKLITISKDKTGVAKFKTPKFKLITVNNIPVMFGSEALLQDCFYNLIDNAFDAMREKFQLILNGELQDASGSNYQAEIEVRMEAKDNFIMIDIKDNGIGLKKENQRKLFAPYFTTKATSGKGTGLGLYVIRDFVEMHKGTITCDSEYGIGTTFTIKLPINKNSK
ncbi:MAG: ATP-binding protein [Candidatus Omnitrophota bacterium]